MGANGRAREAFTGYLYLTPALVVLGAFFVYPFVKIVEWSLYSQTGVFTHKRDVFVGVSRWGEVLGGRQFTNALGNTALLVAYTVPTGLVLGTVLAVVAHRRLRGIRFFQTVFSSTVATSVAVASVVFYALVNPEIGYFRNVGWLSWLNTGNPHSALAAVSVSIIWQNLGLTFVIVLAGLQAIPDELTEAATLDGYGAVRRFFKMTVPLLSPTLMFLAVVLVVFGLQSYAQIDIMTKGGPHRVPRVR